MDYKIILYIVFGLIPSLTWLFYYLRKDVHPESKKMILKIFGWGALVTVPVFFTQIFLAKTLQQMALDGLVYSIIYWFIVISFTEEIFKFLVVKFRVLANPEFDEPVDTMIYMVIVALGFAGLENMLYLFSPAESLPFAEVVNRTVVISFVRFIGATFLHTLCSAVIGYFLALSFRDTKNRAVLFTAGLFLSTLLHGLYDFSIMVLSGPLKLIVPVAVLVSLAWFVVFAFDNLKKAKSVCIIKS